MFDLDDVSAEYIDDLIACHEHLEQLAHLVRDYTKEAHHQKMQQILQALKRHRQTNNSEDLV